MNALKFTVLWAVLGLVVLSVGHSSAVAQDAGAVFARLQQKYNGLDGLRAEFTQTMTSAYSDEKASSSGTLTLAGDRYRVETAGQVLVANGTETYVYLPEQQQVIINDVVEDESAFTPSEFLLNYDERFNVGSVEAVTLGGQKHFKLSLTPKSSSSFFQTATLWLRDRDDVITRLEVLDVNETRMVFELKNVQFNPALDAATFRFTPPAGAEVIDLRS